MRKINVIIERGKDGSFGVYMDDNDLTFGLIGDGATVQEALNDFYNSRDEMKVYYEKEGKEFPDLEFIYSYDIPSFLQYYSNKLSLAGLERITGVNQGQLSHYITGRRKPSKRTTEKIEKALHDFADDLRQVNFV